MCALKVRDSMRTLACIIEGYPLRCEAVMGSYRPKPLCCQSTRREAFLTLFLPVLYGFNNCNNALQVRVERVVRVDIMQKDFFEKGEVFRIQCLAIQ